MRDSKFRGKRVDTGEWAYGHLFIEGCYCFIIGNDSDTEWNIDLGVYLINGNGMIEIDPATVGEYTGLSYTGLDIYEGDILKLYGGEPYDNGVISFMDYDWEFTGHVIFQNGSFVVSESNDACCIWIDAIFCEDIDVERRGMMSVKRTRICDRCGQEINNDCPIIDEARKIVDLLDAVDEFLKADAKPRQFVYIDEIDKLRQVRQKLGGEE